MNSLEQLLRDEICAHGAISFHRFMELALYCPDLGYYERARVGRRGDFYTSVAAGPLFGELLAAHAARQFEAFPDGGIVHLVEAGAHDGTLPADILGWFRTHRPTLMDRLEYWILEPSFRRRECQAAKLARCGAIVRWWKDWNEPGPGSVRGMIFANELLDALPVHRLGWDARGRRWFEWGVTCTDASSFQWSRLANSNDEWQARLEGAGFPLEPGLLEVLPDGFTVEHGEGAVRWWRDAARALRQGILLTFDYGLERGGLLAPHRPEGTLRAYSKHRLAADPLACPGQQDLTAHINFAAIEAAGLSEGLETACLDSQSRFLTRILESQVAEGRGDLGAVRVRQFHTLTHPEHLGRTFQVLVQTRKSWLPKPC